MYALDCCKDASASLEPKIPKSHQEQATDAVNSLLGKTSNLNQSN